MIEGESETKQRRQHFSVQLRREEHEHSFAERRVALAGRRRQGAGMPQTLQKFRELREELQQSRSEEQLLTALVKMRELLSTTRDPKLVPAAQFIQAGLVPDVCALARRELAVSAPNRPRINAEAVWVLSNAVSCDAEHYPLFLENDILGIAFEAMAAPRGPLVRHALWMVANLIGEDPSLRRAAIDRGLYPLAFAAIEANLYEPFVVDVAAWFASNSMRCDWAPFPALEAQLLDCALQMLRTAYTYEAVHECLWAVAFYLDKRAELEQRVCTVFAAGALPYALAHLDRPEPGIQRPLARLLGYLAYSNAQAAQEMYGETLRDWLTELLLTRSPALLSDSLWLLGNLAATSAEICAELCTPELLSAVLGVVEEDCQSESGFSALTALLGLMNYMPAEALRVLVEELGLADLLLRQLSVEPRRQARLYKRVLSLLAKMLRLGREFEVDCAQRVRASPAFANFDRLYELPDASVYEEAEQLAAEWANC